VGVVVVAIAGFWATSGVQAADKDVRQTMNLEPVPAPQEQNPL
jgi:hypothetical protein